MVIGLASELGNNDYGNGGTLFLGIWGSIEYLQFYFKEHNGSYCNYVAVKYGILDADKKKAGIRMEVFRL